MMTQRLWFGVLLLAGSSVAQAQVRPQFQETTFSPRPLTAQEGKVIVNAAWERDQQAGRKPDCSHLVHEVYTLAGYPYPYASSFDLYVGIGSFVRVAKPQSGDLVVWRGHVGIVVDPAEHSFYSSVRSGLRTEFYDAPNWKTRGPARYYRYVAAKPANLVLARNRSPKTPGESASINTEPAFEDSHENLPGSTHPIAKGSDTTSSAVPGSASPSTRATFEIPSSILIATAQDKPSQEEIARAISELNSATGDILREQDSSQVRGKVIIYDDLRLESAKIKGKHGSVQARIESPVTLVGERIEQMQLNGKLRWDLLRMNDGWQVLAPKNSIYVPRDVAIRMLAARLALLTQEGNVSDGDSLHQQAQIVRVLSTLLH
jgi:NlpC/P60 family